MPTHRWGDYTPSGHLGRILDDKTPQLGGMLDGNGFTFNGAVAFEAKAGEALSKGNAVYVSGVSGNKPVVMKADADDAAKMPAFGIAETDANLNANVNVVTFGTVYEIDTSAYSAGDELYVSTTAGELTATKPTGATAKLQNIGKVIRSHASAGSIKVGGAGRTNAVPNLDDGTVFIGDSNNQAEQRALVLADISDYTSPTETDPVYTASSWYTTTNNSSNWDTAYGWGDHASAGYFTTSNDGSGSGLDADLLDGVHGSSFLRSDANDTVTGRINFDTNTGTYPLRVSRLGGNTTQYCDFWVDDGYTNFKHVGDENDEGRFRFWGDPANASNTVLLSFDMSNITYKGNTIWHSGNDGSGSGLDADTVDGIQGSSFLRSDANDTATGVIDFTGGSSSTPAVRIRSQGTSWSEGLAIHPRANNGYALSFYRTRTSLTDQANTWAIGNLGQNSTNNFGLLRKGLTGGSGIRNDSIFDVTQAGVFRFGFNPTVGSSAIWHSGNDGSGSGLDADTLDGYDSTAFRTESNTLSPTSGTWYTIAYNVGNRASARFHIRDTKGGRHQTIQFYASHMYGNGNAINVVHTNVFSTSPIRYIRIKEGGTYDGALLQVYFDNTSSFRAYMYENDQSSGWVLLSTPVVDGSSSGINVNNFAALTNIGAQVDIDKSLRGGFIGTGSLYMGGNITAYSDRRVKTNLEVIPNALDKVTAINGYTFDRTDQFKDDGKQTGLIAQEVLEVLPEAVIGDEEGGYALAYGNMVGLLVEAIKEQQIQIEELKRKL